MSETNGTIQAHEVLANAEPYALRQDLKVLRDAISARWNIKPETKATMLARIDDLLTAGRALSPRELGSIGRTLAAFESNDLKALEIIDKIHRLDTGGATENVQQAVRVIIERDDG